MGDHSDIDHTGIAGVGGSVATDAIWDAAGDLVVGSGANTAAKLTKGDDDDVLTMVAGAVAWAPATGGGGGVTTTTNPELAPPATGTDIDMSGAATGTSVTATASSPGCIAVEFSDNSHQYWDVSHALGTGDFDVRCRIITAHSKSVTSSPAGAPYGGLYVADSSRTASTRYITALSVPGHATNSYARTILNASFTGGQLSNAPLAVPVILRIARVSGTLTTYVSLNDGRSWTALATAGTNTTDFQKVGLNCHNNSGGTGVFIVDWFRYY